MRAARRVLIAVSGLALVLITIPVGAQSEGAITGTVKDAVSGEPLEDIRVIADGSAAYGADYTDDQGTFLIGDLPPGDYRVAAGNWVDMDYSVWAAYWWPGADNYWDAGEVQVLAGQTTTGIDLALSYGGVVTGTITDAWTGESPMMEYIAIEKMEHGSWVGGWGYEVAPDGTYRIFGLEGEYRLSLWNNDYLPLETEPFTIEPGETLSFDLVLTPAYGTPFATVAGVACEAPDTGGSCWVGEGEPNYLGRVEIEARSPDGTLLGATTTDPWGWFLLENLTPGEMVISISEPPAGMELMSPVELELGPNEGAWDVELLAQRIEVGVALDSSLQPMTMKPGDEAVFEIEAIFARVKAFVTPFDVSGVEVSVHLPTGVEYVNHTSDGTFDPATGIWSVDALPYMGRSSLQITMRAPNEGTYRPHAEVMSSDWPDSRVVHGDGQGYDYTGETLLVAVPAPEPAPVALAELGGIVWLDTDADGILDDDESGIENVRIGVIGDETRSALTDGNGRYTVTELVPGGYEVVVDEESLPDEAAEAPESVVIDLAGNVTVDVSFAIPVRAGSNIWWIIGTIVLALAGGTALTLYLLRDRRPIDEPNISEPKREVAGV